VDEGWDAWQNCTVKLATWREENDRMSMQSHLGELERRHRALEDELAEALAHPSTDDLKIAELKRRKLLVKDQIARMQHGAAASVH
jgi:hypothetical protein